VAQGSVNTSGATFTGGGNFGQIDYVTVPPAQTGCAFADGSVWGTSAVTGSFVSKTSLTLNSTDTTALGALLPVTPIAYTYDPLYDEASDLSKTAGNWMGQTGTVININADGVIFSQDAVTGCVLNGQITVIDPAHDAYSVTVTFANCQSGAAGLNGTTAIGLAALNDKSVPSELYLGYTLTLMGGESFMVATVATATQGRRGPRRVSVTTFDSWHLTDGVKIWAAPRLRQPPVEMHERGGPLRVVLLADYEALLEQYAEALLRLERFRCEHADAVT
jgi:hypothetical protein